MDVHARSNEAARDGRSACSCRQGPGFLECRTYRFRAHSMFDAELYRDKSEVEEWKKRDPIATLDGALRACGAAECRRHGPSSSSGVEQEIAEAVAFAEAGTWEPVETLTRDVYTRQPQGRHANGSSNQLHGESRIAKPSARRSVRRCSAIRACS